MAGDINRVTFSSGRPDERSRAQAHPVRDIRVLAWDSSQRPDARTSRATGWTSRTSSTSRSRASRPRARAVPRQGPPHRGSTGASIGVVGGAGRLEAVEGRCRGADRAVPRQSSGRRGAGLRARGRDRRWWRRLPDLSGRRRHSVLGASRWHRRNSNLVAAPARQPRRASARAATSAVTRCRRSTTRTSRS